jgi:hypothetical protein
MVRCVVLAMLLAAGCGKGASEDQCKQLLDHLVDLEFKRAGATATADSQKAELEKQKATVVEAKSTEFMAACMEKTAKDRVECALAASVLECPESMKDCQSVARCDNSEAQ